MSDRTAPAPAPVTAPVSDAQRDRELRRAKASATALLLAAAAVYLLTVLVAGGGADGWVGFVQAAAEAGMVGGLADWFAVTALFRHPLRLPIPHTALIPRRKAELGESLADFVGTHFLAPDVVRDRLSHAQVPRRVGTWLARPDHARRVTAELAAALRAGVGVLRDDDVRGALEGAVVTRLESAQLSPVLGGLLGRVVEDGAHHSLVDLAVRELRGWWSANRAVVVDAVTAQAPLWSPRFVDERVAAKAWTEGERVLAEVDADPDHPFRRSLDSFLARLSRDLAEDPATRERVEAAKAALLHRGDVRDAFGDLLTAARRLLLEVADDPDSELRRRTAAGLARFGTRLVDDEDLGAAVERRLADVLAYAVGTYRGEVTALITETVDRWDGEETSRRVERAVGRDLQFIRINGTVVGALAGVAIHTVTVLLP